MGKRYYEVEFGVWVEEPDPLKQPACEAAWPDEWDYGQGTRPRCFRPEGHEGEHHETRKLSGGDGVVEYYWTDEPGSGRSELRDKSDADAEAGGGGDASASGDPGTADPEPGDPSAGAALPDDE